MDFYKHFFDTGSRLETVRSPPFVSVAVLPAPKGAGSGHLRSDVLARMRDMAHMCSRVKRAIVISRLIVLGCSDLSLLTTELAWAGREGRTGGG